MLMLNKTTAGVMLVYLITGEAQNSSSPAFRRSITEQNNNSYHAIRYNKKVLLSRLFIAVSISRNMAAPQRTSSCRRIRTTDKAAHRGRQ